MAWERMPGSKLLREKVLNAFHLTANVFRGGAAGFGWVGGCCWVVVTWGCLQRHLWRGAVRVWSLAWLAVLDSVRGLEHIVDVSGAICCCQRWAALNAELAGRGSCDTNVVRDGPVRMRAAYVRRVSARERSR
jgi:hypothetical protein